MESKNPWDRIFALAKINYILQNLEDRELNVIDKKLIKGVYTRQQNEYANLQKKNEFDENGKIDSENQSSDENSIMTDSSFKDKLSNLSSIRGLSDLR